MSQWGNLDSSVLTGTANVVNGNAYVVGRSGATYATETETGYALLIANVAYRIEQILSANTIRLDTTYVGTTANNLTIAVQQSPKNLTTTGWGANTTDKQNVYGVDKNEIANTLVKAKGFTHTGWATHLSYQDAKGNQRYKTETLVAMSKNFNANATYVLQTDANDDLVLPE